MTAAHRLSVQQEAEANLAGFVSQVAMKADGDFCNIVMQGQQNMHEIARECASAQAAVEALPHAARRVVGLGSLVAKRIEEAMV